MCNCIKETVMWMVVNKKSGQERQIDGFIK